MADIKDRISSLKKGGYFVELQTVTTNDGQLAIYVIVKFPHNWVIGEEVEGKYGVTVMENDGKIWFCGEMNSGFDIIFDAIDYCIEHNKEAEERARLLAEKIRDLRDVFEDETVTLEALRTLEFSFSTTRKRRKDKPIEQPATKSEQSSSYGDGEVHVENKEELVSAN